MTYNSVSPLPPLQLAKHINHICVVLQVNFWERLRMTIPYTAMEVNAQRERYRILRVNVMTVVPMYNKVHLLLFHLLD